MKIKLAKPEVEAPKVYREHQVKMADYFSKTVNPALLVEMRLGKTLVAIRETRKKGYNLIAVVAPIHGMVAWKNQLEEEGEIYIEAYGMSSALRAERIRQAESAKIRVWVLINYEGFLFVPEMLDVRWDSVILDESVKIKNPKSKISRLLTKNLFHVDQKVILTGMVAPENLVDIYQQMIFLHERFMNTSSFWSWRAKFFDPSFDGYSWVPKPKMRDYIIKLMHEKSCVIRRKDVGMEKKKYYTVRTVGMTPEQRKLYAQIAKDFSYDLSAYGSSTYDETVWATTRAIWLSRVASGFSPNGEVVLSNKKAEELLYLLTSDLAGEKVVVWYKFRKTLAHDLEFLQANGISCCWMVGRTKSEGTSMSQIEAEKQEKAFMKGQAQVMLCMESLGAYAKDFSIASAAIYRENEVSFDLRAQSEDRILNIGKQGGLSIIDMVTEDTLEEVHLQSLRMKKFDASIILGNSMALLKGWTK